MPDAPAFRLPRPLQPASHHALGLHNAPVFEYDLKEFIGESGAPLLVLEPRRSDGKPQGPFAWFRSRVIEGVNEAFGGGAMLVIHEIATSGKESWLLTHDIPVPVIDDSDPAVKAQLKQIEVAARAAGVRPEIALQQAVMAGVLKPVDVKMRKAIVEIKPESVTEVLTELFSHHVEPPLRGRGKTSNIGFAGQAQRQDAAAVAVKGGHAGLAA